MNYKPITSERDDKSINVLDLFKYLLHNWYWFALSVLIFGAYYYYDYSKTPYLYAQQQTVMIKTPANTPSTARLTRTNATGVNVSTEILQLKSKDLMRQTISRLQADVSYSIKDGLREIELYKSSPIQIIMSQVEPNATFKFEVIPLDDKTIKVKGLSDDVEQTIRFNTEVVTRAGKVRFLMNPNTYKAYLGEKITINKYSRETMMSFFMSNITITQTEEDASVLGMHMQDLSSSRAADVLSKMIEVFNEISREDKATIANSTSKFIFERLNIIESELGEVESDIERLKTANEGMDVGSVAQMYTSEQRSSRLERTNIETEIRLVEMMRDQLVETEGTYELIPNNTGLVDGNVESRIAEYNSTLLRRNRLAESSSAQNPVVQDLDKTLDAMRSNITLAVNNALEGLKIKRNNTRDLEQQARSGAISTPKKQRVMLSVERQQKVKEELYIYLLNKREENALNEAIIEDNVRVIDPATGSSAPVSPNKLKKLALGVGIGTVLPAVILLSLLLLDTGVRSRKDIEDVVSAPFLGEVPLVKNSNSSIGDVRVTETGRDALSESFRIIRTNINFMSKNGIAPQVMTFTSFRPGVGKTFNVLNLATTLSFMNKKVIVLDLDLRKGTLTNRININATKGLTHYLSSSNVQVADIIYSDPSNSNLSFAPIGVIAPNPVELLLSNRLDDLIKGLREEYDYILVDGVPVGMVADASIVDRISDLTIFIVRVGKMDRRQLPEIERIYKENKLTNLAVVLNGLKKGGVGYGYGYGYGSYGYGGYGYGYGYGDQENKKWWQRILGK